MRVIRAGHTAVTDLGRFAGPSQGLSVYGALDQGSAALANTLVGNAANAPLLEVLASGVEMLFTVDSLVAVTGSPTSHATLDGIPIRTSHPVSAQAGQTLSLGPAVGGLRTYVAFRGGLPAARLLGSCAPDGVLGFGRRLEDGDELDDLLTSPPLRNPYFGVDLIDLGLSPQQYAEEPVIPVITGPDWEQFGESVDVLFTETYAVDPRSNHIGIRLSGSVPRRTHTGEVLSRGVPVGAIEVPSDQGLLVLHRGRGVTAGYPVLAVVTLAGQDRMAQVRPGQHLRFSLCDIDEARNLIRQNALRRQSLRRRVRRILGSQQFSMPTNDWTE